MTVRAPRVCGFSSILTPAALPPPPSLPLSLIAHARTVAALTPQPASCNTLQPSLHPVQSPPPPHRPPRSFAPNSSGCWPLRLPQPWTATSCLTRSAFCRLSHTPPPSMQVPHRARLLLSQLKPCLTPRLQLLQQLCILFACPATSCSRSTCPSWWSSCASSPR